jgi:hypothetical protein
MTSIANSLRHVMRPSNIIAPFASLPRLLPFDGSRRLVPIRVP